MLVAEMASCCIELIIKCFSSYVFAVSLHIILNANVLKVSFSGWKVCLLPARFSAVHIQKL